MQSTSAAVFHRLANAHAGRTTKFYTRLTSAARTDLDWPALATKPALLYFTEQQPQYSIEMAWIDTWLPVMDILAGKINGMLADPSIDPVQALADADKEAQAKYTEIRGK